MTEEIHYSIQVPLGTNKSHSKKPIVTWHICKKNVEKSPSAISHMEMDEEILSTLMKTLNQIQSRIDFLKQ